VAIESGDDVPDSGGDRAGQALTPSPRPSPSW
jgi:hypothetical protein